VTNQGPELPAITPDRICAWLDGLAIGYRRLTHAITRTSEESASARGEPLEIGAKALVLKADERFVLLVLSAARRLDNEAAKALLGARRVRFADRGELRALTGLEPGSVPPFGRPIVALDLFVDGSLTRLERVAFNAGSLTESLVMAGADYLRAAQPNRIAEFAAAPGPE
jgi:Ala-tRNA(Pro) deacylase